MDIVFSYMIALYFFKFSMFYNHCIYYSNHQIIFRLPYLSFTQQLSPRRPLIFPLVSTFLQYQNFQLLTLSNTASLEHETTVENHSPYKLSLEYLQYLQHLQHDSISPNALFPAHLPLLLSTHAFQHFSFPFILHNTTSESVQQ